jgi:hypothetical protein
MKSLPLVIPQTLSRKLSAAAIAVAAILAVTAMIAPDRAWANLLLGSYFLVTLGLGGALFIALTNVCGASWSVAFRRVPEAMTGLIPLGGTLVIVALLAHLKQYAWHHHGDGDAGTFWFKELWLKPEFFAARAVAFILLWSVFSRILVNHSRRQDTVGREAATSASGLTSVLFLAMFAVSISLAGVDWIMALEPMWFSTMWGVYQFSGLILSTLAAMIVACILLRRRGPLANVFHDEHLHDLSKLLLGFSCFWMYIWFSQYMLIWYSNIPEETSYFIRRTHGPWGPVVLASILLNWVIPFFVLLPRPCKRSESVMLKIATVVLLGRWVDLYIMIFPPVTGSAPVFGIPEVATMVGLSCLIPLLFMRSFTAAAPVPQNDPWLADSLHYHA